MIHYVIPARKDSKGIPLKNRSLFHYTARTIPPEQKNNVIVSTNDEHIKHMVRSYGFSIHQRSEKNSKDTSSTKDFMLEVIEDMSLKGDICMLYLTYPERTWKNVTAAYDFFKENKAKSLLCREELATHPYVCLYDKEGFRGEQVINHNLCRRQDYPKCFKVCHKIAILRHSEIENLNSNIYNSDTIYFPVDKTLDIDTPSDLKKLKETR